VPKSAGPRPEPKPGGRPINIHADIQNADWLRSLSWDLPTEPDIFLATIGRAGMTDAESVRAFMTLPASRPMPSDLRAELARRGLLAGDAPQATERDDPSLEEPGDDRPGKEDGPGGGDGDRPQVHTKEAPLNAELARLLEQAERSGPGERIELRDRLARHGAAAVEAMVPWLADARLAWFAVRVITAAHGFGATHEAIAALRSGVDEPVTPQVQDDLIWSLDRVDPGWRRRRERQHSRVDSPIGILAKDPSRERRYMHAWTLWHRILDEVVSATGSKRYLSPCHRWNNDHYVDSGDRRIQTAVPPGQYCYLCDQAESRTRAPMSGPWRSVKALWADAGVRLHLCRERTWHLAVGDDSVEATALGTMYLTECGWWIEGSRIHAEGTGEPPSPICDQCVRFVRARERVSEV